MAECQQDLLFDFQPDEFFIVDHIDFVGDETERSAGDIDSGQMSDQMINFVELYAAHPVLGPL